MQSLRSRAQAVRLRLGVFKDHKIIRAYGVPARRYLGKVYAQRSVFLIDEEGIVRFVEKQYSVGKDKAALYEEIRGRALREE